MASSTPVIADRRGVPGIARDVRGEPPDGIAETDRVRELGVPGVLARQKDSTSSTRRRHQPAGEVVVHAVGVRPQSRHQADRAGSSGSTHIRGEASAGIHRRYHG